MLGQGTRRRPNIVVALSDDHGWGDVGYRGHKYLRTPELDKMAASGLRFDRFYSGAPICSAARAALLTGRSPHRTGITTHGQALRLQERTVAQALRDANYATGHFGKWHLDGIHGVPTQGGPVISAHSHTPGAFGFETWLSNFGIFDLDPVFGRRRLGPAVYEGESCAVLVRHAVHFMQQAASRQQPFFAAVWFANPHVPWVTLPRFRKPYAHLTKCNKYKSHDECSKKTEAERNQSWFFRPDCDCYLRDVDSYYGEVAAIDESMGLLRSELRRLALENETIVWFQSDNGPENGLRKYAPFPSTAGLRGYKKTLLEGGVRVPAILEWPGVVLPRISRFPSSALDVFPTIAELVGLPEETMQQPQDGMSLVPLLMASEDPEGRSKPIPFCYFEHYQFGNGWALIDNDFKLIRWSSPAAGPTYTMGVRTSFDEARGETLSDEQRRARDTATRLLHHQPMLLFNLKNDSKEVVNLIGRWKEPRAAAALTRMSRLLDEFALSVNRSQNGLDYADGRIWAQPPNERWCMIDCYQPLLQNISELWGHTHVMGLLRRSRLKEAEGRLANGTKLLRHHSTDRKSWNALAGPSHHLMLRDLPTECKNESIPRAPGLQGNGSGSAVPGPTTCRTKGSRCVNEWPWVFNRTNRWSCSCYDELSS